MRLSAILLGLLVAGLNPLAGSTVTGIILANDKGGPGVPNVEVGAIGDANPTSSLSDGTFLLEMPNKQPGDTVQLTVKRQGMVVVNSFELRFVLPKAPNAAPVTLLLCREADVQDLRSRYYGIDRNDSTYRRKFENSQAESERLRVELDLARKAVAAERLAREKAENAPNARVSPPVYRSYEALALNRAATLSYRQGRTEEARKDYDEALKISRNLAQDDPATYLPDVADTLNNLGDMLTDQNRLDEAQKDYDEALKISRYLAHQNATYLPNVALTLNNLGTVLSKQSRLEQARLDFNEALQLYRQLAQLNPNTYMRHVAETLNNLGVLETLYNLGILDPDKKKPEAPRQAFKEALDIYETLARKNPGEYEQEVESAGGLLESALTERLQSYREQEQMQPGAYLPYVADTLKDLGILNYERNQPEQARKALSQGIVLYGSIAKNNPQHGRKALDIFEILVRRTADRHEQELTSIERRLEATFVDALTANRELAERDSKLYLPNVAGMLINLGILYRDQDRMDEARRVLREALAIHKEVYKSLTQDERGLYERNLDSTRRLLQDLDK